MDIDIRELGAVNDGKTLNAQILQTAIDRCAAAGGGKVTVSGGSFMTGGVRLRSNVNLHIAADGILLGSPNCGDYPDRTDVTHVDSYRLTRWRNACMIFAENSENIAITGAGTIDCNGHHFVMPREGHTKGWTHQRIRNIYFSHVHTREPEMPILKGRQDCHLSRIHFSDCTFDLTDGTEIENRPFHGGDSYRDAEHRPMLLRYADDLQFRDTQFYVL